MFVHRPHLAIVLVLTAALGCVAGCALFKDRSKIEQTVTDVQEKIEPVVEHSLAVLQCASFMQRMAFDSGKNLPTSAAIAFCAALEASPDVAPSAPTQVEPPKEI